jgi:hypothetical protein
MKWFTVVPVALVGLMGGGWSGRDDLEPLSAQSRQGEAEGRVWVKGCWYQVSISVEFPPFPPQEFLKVERLPSRHCEAASTLLEEGYYGGNPLLTTQGGELAVAWTRYGSPSGSATANVLVFHVSPETLSVERTAFLSVYPNDLSASSMSFEGHRLVLDTSAGPVTLPHFLTSEEPPQGLPPPPWGL